MRILALDILKLLALAFGLLNCAQTAALVPLKDQKVYVESRKSAMPADLLEGAVWVDQRTLLVNRDFNMAMAMGMDLIGPAIAAGQRISENQNLAKKLAGINFSEQTASALQTVVSACGSNCQGSSVGYYNYALLYGSEQARLLTILEWKADNRASISSLISISEPRHFEGEKSWLEVDTIQKTRDLAFYLMSKFLKQHGISSIQGKDPLVKSDCKISGMKTIQGVVAARVENTVVIHSSESPNALFLCPKQESKAGT